MLNYCFFQHLTFPRRRTYGVRPTHRPMDVRRTFSYTIAFNLEYTAEQITYLDFNCSSVLLGRGPNNFQQFFLTGPCFSGSAFYTKNNNILHRFDGSQI